MTAVCFRREAVTMVSRMMMAKNGALVPISAQTTAAAMAASARRSETQRSHSVGKLFWGLGPLRERFRVDADLEVLAEDCDVFAKIEMVAEFVDGGLTLRKLGTGEGARSQAARVSSPMRVRARERSSKRLPGPKRSRSVA